MPDKYFLSKGAHSRPEDGRCAMEFVSYIAGESHTDKPQCVSPVLREFAIKLNDALDDVERQKLRPYLARCIGTAGDGRDNERRWLCADWLIRTYVPAWMDLTPALVPHAEAIRALPPILAAENVNRAMVVLEDARKASAAARDAAWAAARAAARDAAWAAARDAARDAAWDAAWAAARDAAWDAAWAAARAAARAALAPTVDHLRASLFDLFDRMLPTEVIQVPVRAEWRELCRVGA